VPAGRTLAALIGGTLLLLLVVWIAGPGRLAASITRASPPWVVAGLLGNAGFIALRGWRWQVLLRPVAPELTVRRATAATALGWGIHSVMPFKVGDPVRAYAIGMGRDPAFLPALASVVVERILDVLALGLLALLGLALARPPGQAQGSLARASMALAIAVAALLALFAAARWPQQTRDLIGRALTPLPDSLRPRVLGLATSALAGIRALGDLPVFGAVLALSLAVWAVQLTATLCFYRAVASPAAPATLLLAVAIFTIAQSVSVTPGNIGTYEGTFALIFGSWFGLANTSDLTSAALLSHVLSALLFVGLGALALRYLGGHPQELWSAGWRQAVAGPTKP
jgi:uncharacterized protein (TIRG00374 family)